MNKSKLFFSMLLIIPLLMTGGCSDEEDSATASNGGGGGGLGDSIPTGIVSHRDFRIGFDPGAAPVFDNTGSYSGGEEVSIVIRADDINDLVVDGQTVNIRTEWGTFTEEKDSCVLSNGACSVTWLPGDKFTAPSSRVPIPVESAECRVAFTAWTNGEEKFADINGNGLFDSGETFTDLPEPYLDINESGLFSDSLNGYINGWDGGAGFCNSDLICEMIDTNGDSVHNDADGLYNGTLCASGNAQCSATTSILVWTTSYLVVSDVDGLTFDHDDDTNTAEIGVCSGFK